MRTLTNTYGFACQGAHLFSCFLVEPNMADPQAVSPRREDRDTEAMFTGDFTQLSTNTVNVVVPDEW